MAGTVRGKIECLISSGNAYNNHQALFTIIYKFLKQLESAGVTNEIARHGGLGSSSSNVNFYDEADPFLTNAWYLFRFNTNGGRSWPWYFIAQWARADSSDFGQSPGNPGIFMNVSSDPAIGGCVGFQAAVGIGGDQNPWNGTTGAQATKGSTVWRVPSNGGTGLAIFPRTNSADYQYGIRATGGIIPVAGSALADGETFTIGDGLTAAKVFEFDFGGGVTPGNYPVSVNAGMTVYQVRDAIISAINGLHGVLTDFYIVADVGMGERVRLFNRQPGSIGNVTITDTVADAGFVPLGMSGGSETLRNFRTLSHTAVTTSIRVQLLADDDNLIILTDQGATGAYTGTYIGQYLPNSGIVAACPFVFVQGWPLPVSEAWFDDYSGGSYADDGGICVNATTGARALGVSRYSEGLVQQPNSQFGASSYIEFPVFVGMGDSAVTKDQQGFLTGFLGKLDTNMIREVYNVSSHDTTVGKTRAFFGSATLADTKWSVPWDGVTLPGTGLTREGVVF